MKMHAIGPFLLFLGLIQAASLHSLSPFLMDNFPLWHPSQNSILGYCQHMDVHSKKHTMTNINAGLPVT